MIINETREGNTLILAINGRVDTVTAPQLQSTVLSGFQKCSHVVVDCTEAEYISSAGLRAFLIGQKTAASKGGSLKIRNINEVVRAVFTSTGFDKILLIE